MNTVSWTPGRRIKSKSWGSLQGKHKLRIALNIREEIIKQYFPFDNHLNCFKGTLGVILCDSTFVEWHVPFTLISVKPLLNKNNRVIHAFPSQNLLFIYSCMIKEMKYIEIISFHETTIISWLFIRWRFQGYRSELGLATL